MGPLPVRAPFRICTLSKQHLTRRPWTPLSKDPQNHRCQAYPVPQSCKSQTAKVSPCFCQSCLFKPTNSAECVVGTREPSRAGSPLGMSPQAIGYSCFLPAAQRGLLPGGDLQSHSVIIIVLSLTASPSPSLTASLSEVLGSCSNSNIRCSSSSKHLCTLRTGIA